MRRQAVRGTSPAVVAVLFVLLLSSCADSPTGAPPVTTHEHECPTWGTIDELGTVGDVILLGEVMSGPIPIEQGVTLHEFQVESVLRGDNPLTDEVFVSQGSLPDCGYETTPLREDEQLLLFLHHFNTDSYRPGAEIPWHDYADEVFVPVGVPDNGVFDVVNGVAKPRSDVVKKAFWRDDFTGEPLEIPLRRVSRILDSMRES